MCGIIGGLIAYGIWSLGPIPLTDLIGGEANTYDNRMLLRLGVMANHVSMFLIPVIIFGLLFQRGNFIKFLSLDQILSLKNLALWGMVIVVSYPLVGYLTILNEQIEFPDFLRTSQEQTFEMLSDILTMDNYSELALNIFIVGVLAAIGEELLFRGIIQQKLQRYFSNPHYGIILAGLLFGGIHMQVERFLPLSSLGILLGYSFYYTKSILVPIILHFLNNSVQVVSLYAIDDMEIANIDGAPDIPIWMMMLSLIATLAIIWYTSQEKSVVINEV